MSFVGSNEGKIRAEYVWIGNGIDGGDLRSKGRVLDRCETNPEKLPEWNYDGSSTNQATGDNSDIIIKPRAVFRDPFRGPKDILVMCDSYMHDGVTPIPTNSRAPAKRIFDQGLEHAPWFGIEQEYIMFRSDGKTPLGFPTGGGFPRPQGPYYCAVGHENINYVGRQVVEEHFELCLLAGVKIGGINAEVCPGQWEFQVGPVEGIFMGDHLWMARYILQRVGEKHGVVISFDPKPIQEWSGSGGHTNFSTKAMREDGGLKVIEDACIKFGRHVEEHIKAYGYGNERRLTGLHETQCLTKYSWGVADRGSSIRIPRQTQIDGRGYLEDRRPAANMDPYLVTSIIFKNSTL
ncbi:glutamine synthetase [Acrasis kona]|uniref:glutamine synthetase n=1 Tax=Acrasis kona TaxID=1008807 RepID=A0AAW2YPY8_9EUKA